MAQYTVHDLGALFGGMEALEFLRFLNAYCRAEVIEKRSMTRENQNKWLHIDTLGTAVNRRWWKQLSAFLTMFFHLMYSPLLAQRHPVKDEDILPFKPVGAAYAIFRQGIVGVGMVHTDAGPNKRTSEDKLDCALTRDDNPKPMAMLIALSEQDRCVMFPCSMS